MAARKSKPKKKIGRPPRSQSRELNLKLQKQICGLILMGNTLKVACQAVGIGLSTFGEWLERGKKDREGPYYELAEAVLRANAQAEATYVSALQRQTRWDWRAAAFWLEKRSPKDWTNPADGKAPEGAGS